MGVATRVRLCMGTLPLFYRHFASFSRRSASFIRHIALFFRHNASLYRRFASYYRHNASLMLIILPFSAPRFHLYKMEIFKNSL